MVKAGKAAKAAEKEKAKTEPERRFLKTNWGKVFLDEVNCAEDVMSKMEE